MFLGARGLWGESGWALSPKGADRYGGQPLQWKPAGFRLTAAALVCIMNNEYMLWLNRKAKTDNSQSGRQGAGQMRDVYYPIPNGKYSITEPERLGAVSSFVQSKPNFACFWANNAGWVKKQSQSKPIFTTPEERVQEGKNGTPDSGTRCGGRPHRGRKNWGTRTRTSTN